MGLVGLVDLWTCELVDMWTCGACGLVGLVYLWTCGTCGLVDCGLWIFGLLDL